MDKLVAVVFNDEKAAYQGTRALAEMNTEGSVDVGAMCVIKKEADGQMSTKQVEGEFPMATVAGTAIGAVIGVLGGPIGMAGGAAVGAWAGMVGDLYAEGIDVNFVSDVSAALTPGKCAVLAEVEEEWVTPLDTRMEALGGVVYRTYKWAVEEDHWRRDVAAARAELDQLKAEHARARADRKAKLEAQIDRLSKRLQAKLEHAQTRSQQITQEFQAKVQALQQKADKAKGDAKAALEARIAKLRSNYQSRPHA
jgi:uncharacterized membrane protein